MQSLWLQFTEIWADRLALERAALLVRARPAVPGRPQRRCEPATSEPQFDDASRLFVPLGQNLPHLVVLILVPAPPPFQSQMWVTSK